MNTLLLGFGNFDRQDDGVAWHVLARVAARLGLPVPISPDEEFPEPGADVDFMFTLQLTPEQAETIAQYDRVYFVDAHTGSIPNEVNIEPIQPAFQRSPLTHHMTPQTCLALASSLYGRIPHAILVSVRGYEFGFIRTLSPEADRLATLAAEKIIMEVSHSL